MIDAGKMTRNYLYEAIADKIESMIINKTIKIGEKLPPETALAQSYGVSRNILREAFKILRERGLIDVKSGDGVYVAAPETDILKDIINRFLSFENISLINLYDFRFAIEISAAQLAAENANDENIERLESILEQMKSSNSEDENWPRYELDFHLEVAKASKNPLFYTFLSPVSNLLLDTFYKGGIQAKDEGTVEGLKGHKSIIQAIKAGDSSKAGNAMSRHLKKSMQFILEYLDTGKKK